MWVANVLLDFTMKIDTFINVKFDAIRCMRTLMQTGVLRYVNKMTKQSGLDQFTVAKLKWTLLRKSRACGQCALLPYRYSEQAPACGARGMYQWGCASNLAELQIRIPRIISQVFRRMKPNIFQTDFDGASSKTANYTMYCAVLGEEISYANPTWSPRVPAF